ncbi:hypothetical protein MBRA_05750 [Methylobacterium brachiatum]|jgi:hypothetical protein|nr:hypothetical protein MBRA_05750 [Methylobacterium brachiatum]
MARPTLATSLTPRPARQIAGGREIGHLNQYRCLESWRESGFHVVSVNAADEADAVQVAYPDVQVVVAERDARSLCGRPRIPLSEMIRTLQAAEVTWGGIASADVRVACPNLLRRIADEGRNGGRAIFLSRADAVHPCDDAGVLDPSGPSAILFDVGRAAGLDVEPFAVGLPGWGRALAMALLLTGSQAICPAAAALLHLNHPSAWRDDLQQHLFAAFRTRFLSELAVLQGEAGAEAQASLAAVADLGRHAETYADLAARRPEESGTAEIGRRYRAAYAAAVADLIRDLAVAAPQAEISNRT